MVRIRGQTPNSRLGEFGVRHRIVALHVSRRNWQSPAKAVEHLRIEAARVMMEQTRHPIETVAAETGFADRERMRRAFIRTFGQPPQVVRRNAQFTEMDEKV